jgi:hypothetical protein
MRTRRTVLKAGNALGIEAGDPSVRALAGDPHGLRDMGDRHVLFTNALHK